MTNEHRKENIANELVCAEDALESARILLAAGKLRDALSRAYYGAFHYARALLLTAGAESKTHAGVERLIQRDFVRAQKLDPAVALILSDLQRMRQAADYGAEFVFTVAVVDEKLKAAETFASAVTVILDAGGWRSI